MKPILLFLLFSFANFSATGQVRKNNKVKSQKHYNYAFYLNVNKLSIASPDVEYWDIGASYSHSELDSTWFSMQNKFRYTYSFTTKSSFDVDFIRRIKLNKKINFNYGIGFDYFVFTYDHNFEFIDERIIDKFTLIQNGIYQKPEYKITAINTPIQPLIMDNYYYGFHSVDYSTFSLMLPIEIQYKLQPNLSVQINANAKIPFIATSAGLASNSSLNYEPFLYKSKYNNSVNRVLFCSGIGINYHLFKRCSISFNYSFGLNSLLNPRMSKSNFHFFRIKKTTTKSIGIGLKYDF